VLVTSASFGLHAGNMNYGTQNEDTISVCRITCIILPVHSSVPHVELKYAVEIEDKIYNNAIYSLDKGVILANVY
jgi:hypothetical protein